MCNRVDAFDRLFKDTELNLNYIANIRLAYYAEWDSLVVDSFEINLKNSTITRTFLKNLLSVEVFKFL